MKVAIILPSRGLMFSQTADEILQNVKGIPHKFFFSHRKPLPACFETPTRKALKDKEITHLWFTEEDMILPKNTLKDMLDMDVAVVTANYPTTAKGNSSILSVKGRIVYGGTGCTLVKREVFDELSPPYWRDDIVWQPRNLGDSIRFTAKKRDDKQAYGFHDVNFFMNLFKKDIPVHKLPYTLGQRKLKALGKAGTNDGAHDIEEWYDVQEDRYFTLVKNLPVTKPPKLIEVFSAGKTILVTPNHAKKLIKAGLATKPPKRPVIIDDSEVL